MPVNGPHGDSGATGRRGRRSSLGYRTFACHACRRIFNERSGTPFNELQCPTDLVVVAVRWRLRYKLSVRDVAELLLPRGFEVTHETIRAWEFRFAPEGYKNSIMLRAGTHAAGRPVDLAS